jgi:hypothetical protein
LFSPVVEDCREVLMSSSAHVTSTDAIRDFRAALQQCEADLRDTVAQLVLELRRSLDWVEQDRARYWPAQVRVASDAVVQAQQDLARCESAIRAEDRRSCYEQRMALEKAKQRLRLTEQKVRAVRRLRVSVQREADAMHGRLLRLSDFLDTEFPRALAALGRMSAALDKYTQRSAPQPGMSDSGAASGASPTADGESQETDR